jgi:hypothetical protein
VHSVLLPVPIDDQAPQEGARAKAGPIALLVILLLCTACYFLFRSMTKHLRKVRDEFPGEPPPEPPAEQSAELPRRPSANGSANGSVDGDARRGPGPPQ